MTYRADRFAADKRMQFNAELKENTTISQVYFFWEAIFCCKETGEIKLQMRVLFLFLFNGASGEFISYLVRQHFNPALLGSTNDVWEMAPRDYLDEFEDGKRRCALFSINTA